MLHDTCIRRLTHIFVMGYDPLFVCFLFDRELQITQRSTLSLLLKQLRTSKVCVGLHVGSRHPHPQGLHTGSPLPHPQGLHMGSFPPSSPGMHLGSPHPFPMKGKLSHHSHSLKVQKCFTSCFLTQLVAHRRRGREGGGVEGVHISLHMYLELY